tara:strand:- start:189 stop:1013 length:825 start_codon:yes stop_codon:yes gene_type:complete
MILKVFQISSFLPLSFLHKVGVIFGWAIFIFSSKYRTKFKQNIYQAGYHELINKAIGESGKNIFELPFIWFAKKNRIKKYTTIQGWELVKKALDKKKGVIFLSPHLGSFELIAQIISSRTPLTALYRPQRLKILEELIVKAREKKGLSMTPANSRGVRSLIKTLKKGGSIGLLPDQVPSNGEGLWANFFGKKAYTMTLTAKLCNLSNAQLILTYAERLSGGKGFKIYFFDVNTKMYDSLEKQVKIINELMEQLIKKCPEQYLWSYNRYKGQSIK